MPQAMRTRGLTTPQPPHSIQPSLEHVRHGLSGSPTDAPRQTKHCRSTSALGSVNGKYDGRSRVTRPSPNIAAAKWSSVPLRSAIVMPSSTTRPSTWPNTGVCVASSSSVR